MSAWQTVLLTVMVQGLFLSVYEMIRLWRKSDDEVEQQNRERILEIREKFLREMVEENRRLEEQMLQGQIDRLTKAAAEETKKRKEQETRAEQERVEAGKREKLDLAVSAVFHFNALRNDITANRVIVGYELYKELVSAGADFTVKDGEQLTILGARVVVDHDRPRVFEICWSRTYDVDREALNDG